MFKKLIASTFVLAMMFPSLADVLKIKSDAPQQYVVKKGDTLWDISAIYLDEPWLWPQLWQLNPHIDNPHLIYPGDMLSLVYGEDGQPILVINDKYVKMTSSGNYKKMSPHGRKTMKKEGAIPTLPLELIRPYLTFEQALDVEVMDSKPYVLGANENVKNQVTGHILYVKGNLERSKYYGIYRKGDPYINSKTEEVMAHEAILVGTARAFRAGDVENGVPASVRVKNAKREIKAGDFLMPAIDGQTLPAFFSITRPAVKVDAKIIASSLKLREFSSLDVVVLDVGTNDEVKAGNILDIRRQSPTVIDNGDVPKYLEDSSRFDKIAANFSGSGEADSKLWKMPAEKIGELMVFKTYGNVSYALIMKTLKPIRVGDSASVDP